MNLLAVQCKELFVFPQHRGEWISRGDQEEHFQGPIETGLQILACTRPTGIAARIASVRDWSWKIGTATIRRLPSQWIKNWQRL